MYCRNDQASSRSSTDNDIQVIESIASPEPSSPVSYVPPIIFGTNSPSSPRQRVIQTESEDEGLDGAHYRRPWRTQCQHVRGWKRKHEVLLDEHNWLRARYADMEKRKDEAVFFAHFLKAQSHYLRFKGEKNK